MYSQTHQIQEQQKGRNRGIAYKGSDISFVSFGLKALEN